MARRVYNDEEKQRALAIYETEGLAEASKRTGVPKATLSDWAQANGLRTFGAERTAAATAVRKASIDERRAALAEKLLEVAELGLDLEMEILADGKAPLRDVVGARTRAIHDLQLLSGGSTSRHEHAGLTGEVLDAARDGALRLVG